MDTRQHLEYMIYKGIRIAKIRDWSIDEDSPLYVKDKDLPQVKTFIRFPFNEVKYWGEYGGDANDGKKFFAPIKNEEIIEVTLETKGNVYLIESLQLFDAEMDAYISNRMLFRQQ